MRKIKLIVSDFHLGRGRLDSEGRLNEKEDFHEADRFIEFLEYHATVFESDEVELIFNGDFLEFLDVYDGDYVTDRETENTASWKLQRIMEGHERVFDALAAWASRPRKTVTFLVGNHDQALLWPAVQKALIARIGPRTRVLDNDLNFSVVHVAHGHQHEFLNAFNTRNFWYRDAHGERVLRMPMVSLFVMQYISPLKNQRPYINKVRPFRVYLNYALVNDHIFFWKQLIGIVKFWLRNRTSRDPVTRREFRLSMRRFFNAYGHGSMEEAADQILRNTKYRYVIFGHTHKYEHRRFGAYGDYLNTGTWTELISLNVSNLGKHTTRTYVYVDWTDEENPDVRLKVWHGTHRVETDLIG